MLDAIVISEEEGVAKPSPEFFKRVLDKVNASSGSSNPILPQECMHIGNDLKESVRVSPFFMELIGPTETTTVHRMLELKLLCSAVRVVKHQW